MMSKPQTRLAVRFGLLLGVAEIAYGIFFRVARFPFDSPLTWVFYLMLPAAIWLALRVQALRQDQTRYWQRTGIGAIVVALGSALYCIQVWLYNRVIDDSLLQSVRESQIAALARRGVTGAELDRALERVDLLLQPGPFALAVWVQLLFWGLGFALLLAGLHGWHRRRSSAARVSTA